jgi:hypothetical protein
LRFLYCLSLRFGHTAAEISAWWLVESTQRGDDSGP